MNPIRILNILPKNNCKKAQVFIMNMYRNIDRKNVQFDFLFQGECEGIFNEEIESLGGNIFKIQCLKEIGAYKYRKLARDFFKTHKYDIVHCYLDDFSGVILSEAKKAGVAIRIAHMYNKIPKFNRNGYFRFSVNRNSNYKFAYSKEEGNLFFGEFEKFTLLKNVIDLDEFSYNGEIQKNIKKLLKLNNEKVIGFINKSNKEEKNKKMLSLFKEIRKYHKNSKLILIANDICKEKINNEIKKLNLDANNIVLLEESKFLKQDIIQVFDVMVFLDQDEIENFIIKAQENDLPCIVLGNMDDGLDLNLDLVYRFNYNENEQIIAKNILEKSLLRNSVNQDYIKYKMNKQGYDLKREAKILENFYLREHKNIH